MIEIALLGDFTLRRSGSGIIGLSSEKGALLLTLLALPAGKKHSREAVQGLLWPESDQQHAQGNLRFVLHQARTALGGDASGVLAGDRGFVWLDPAQVVVDATRFEALSREGTLQALGEACDLYRGDLLRTLSGASSEYEDWLLPERERLRDLARSTFWQLFALRLWRGDVAAARECARRYLDIDPYCQRMHAALMRIHVSQGQHQLAAQHFRQLRERLACDLQLRPEADVEQLAHSLQSGTVRRPRRFQAAWVLGREADTVLDDKPLVAVLPFRDLSEGLPLSVLPIVLTESVIADLARFRRLAVLGRHTSFAIGKKTDPEAWFRQLGARYTVEGSVHRAGNRLCVTAKLIDNASMRHLWAERFHGEWEELPLFQERTARAIVSAIPVQVEQSELARVQRTEIHSLTAYELYLCGRDQQRSTAHDSHAKAFAFFASALDRDPRFAAAHAELALSCALGGGRGDNRVAQALEYAQQAVELDPMDPQGHWVLAMMLQVSRDFESARLHLDRAIVLSPGDAETLGYVGLEYAYRGDARQGIELATASIRLNPCHPPAFAELLGKSSFVGRRYEDALFWLRQSPDRVTSNRAWLAAAAAHAGRPDEAATHARIMRTKLREHKGEANLRTLGGPVASLRKFARFQCADDLQHYEDGLAKAGLDDLILESC